MSKIFYVLFLFLVTSSCHMGSKELETEFFEDIDINKLQGVQKLSEPVYPCISIQKSTDSALVTYHKTAFKKQSFTYINKGNYWLGGFTEKGDTANFYTYQLLFPEQVLEISYSDTQRLHPYYLGVLKGNQEVFYVQKKGKCILPDPENLHHFIQNAEYIDVETLTFQGDTLHLNAKRIEVKDTSDTYSIQQFNQKPKSFLWFRHFFNRS